MTFWSGFGIGVVVGLVGGAAIGWGIFMWMMSGFNNG